MQRNVSGPVVAITENRFGKEFERLLTRGGARVVSCPLLEERPVQNTPELGRFVEKVAAGELDIMIFFTGVGIRFLAAEARETGRLEGFVQALDRLTVVGRGPKPRAALRELGLKVDLAPTVPTSEGLLDLLEPAMVRGRRIGIQLYGKPNADFCAVLRERGAELHTVQVYDYGPASDGSRVAEFIRTLLGGTVEVIAFTSAPQVEVLFDVAEREGLADALVGALGSSVEVAVIGEVANRALVEKGITARILPSSPKMGALAAAIIEHLSRSRA